MNKLLYFITDYYDRQVIQRIMEKYGMDEFAAVRAFITSQTHVLLEDADNGLSAYPVHAVFDMWEVERIQGNPRKSVYIRGE